MACAIQAQWDWVELRGNNNEITIDGLGTWTNNVTALFGTATQAAAKAAFIAGSSVVESAYAGTDTNASAEYIRLGLFTDDSSLSMVAGDIISDATGLRPARNFDGNLELNIYTNPTADHAGAAITGYTLLEHRADLEAIVGGCNQFDVLLIDSKNLIACAIGRCSGHLDTTDVITAPTAKLVLDRKIASQSQIFSMTDLTA